MLSVYIFAEKAVPHTINSGALSRENPYFNNKNSSAI